LKADGDVSSDMSGRGCISGDGRAARVGGYLYDAKVGKNDILVDGAASLKVEYDGCVE
jgi:hypothetical protein